MYADQLQDHFQRQQELVPRLLLADTLVTTIVVGAIGRPVALQLAASACRDSS